MEVRPGCKQTELGVIPEDWKVVALQRLTDPKRPISYGIVQTGPNVPNGIRCLRVLDVNNGRINKTDLITTTKEISDAYKRTILKAGDLVIPLRGKVGDVAMVNEDLTGCNLTRGLALIAVRSDWSASFCQQFISSPASRNRLEQVMNGSALQEIPIATLRAFKMAFPPTKAEQEAIAETLSDADAHLESLEQLIAKKRHLKQGAMQELLRPRRSDDVQILRDVSSLKGRIGWQGLKQTEFTANADQPFLITGMNFKDGAIRWDEVYHISEARYEMAKEIQLATGDVLMTKDGTIGKVLYVDNIPYPGKGSLNSHLLLFRPIRDSYDPKYLYYQLSSQRFRDFIELSKSGSTFFGLSQAAVGIYPVLLPPMEQQRHAVAILSDMDAEIAALEAKLTKARQIKRGMTQELLTGRTRLI